MSGERQNRQFKPPSVLQESLLLRCPALDIDPGSPPCCVCVRCARSRRQTGKRKESPPLAFARLCPLQRRPAALICDAGSRADSESHDPPQRPGRPLARIGLNLPLAEMSPPPTAANSQPEPDRPPGLLGTPAPALSAPLLPPSVLLLRASARCCVACAPLASISAMVAACTELMLIPKCEWGPSGSAASLMQEHSAQ